MALKNKGKFVLLTSKEKDKTQLIKELASHLGC
jgi:hypothetical protein